MGLPPELEAPVSHDILDLHARALAETGRLVAAVAPEQLDLPTPLTDWDVRALLRHLVEGNFRSAAVAEGTQPERFFEQRDLAALQEAWRRSADRAAAAWTEPGRLEQHVRTPMGVQPGTLAVDMHLMELVAHGWDLSWATGQSPAYDNDILDTASAFAQRILSGPRIDGMPFAAPRRAPDGADRLTALAAFLGRHVGPVSL